MMNKPMARLRGLVEIPRIFTALQDLDRWSLIDEMDPKIAAILIETVGNDDFDRLREQFTEPYLRIDVWAWIGWGADQRLGYVLETLNKLTAGLTGLDEREIAALGIKPFATPFIGAEATEALISYLRDAQIPGSSDHTR